MNQLRYHKNRLSVGQLSKKEQYSLFNEEQATHQDSPEISFEDFQGNKALLDDSSVCVSVVGSRDASPLGLELTEKVTSALVSNNFVIVSGLAKGVDTIAHKTALKKNGNTISVLGTPLNKIYPAENKDLAKEVASKGLVLTTAKPHETFGKHLFPRRNKAMAQISKATIVIEAGEKSGVRHQCAESLKNGKTLIFLKHQVDQNCSWVDGFIKSGAVVTNSEHELINILNDL